MKSRFRYKPLLVGVALLLVCFAAAFQTAFWSRDHAQARALRAAIEFCQRSGRDPALLVGPREHTISSAPWSFEWRYAGQPPYVVGVWFSRSGHAELYTGPTDDPSSAAYQPR